MRRGWALPPGEVHVWRIPLRAARSHRRCLLTLLDEREQRRVALASSARAAARAVVGRAALRQILAGYLGVAPTDVTFRIGPSGKPVLAGRHRASGLTFNLSHAGDLALCAVARGRLVGVDVERLRRRAGFADVAAFFFTAAECRALRAVPRRARAAAFLRAWTEKEAYVKAVGGDIMRMLNRFEVCIDPAAPPALLRRRSGAELAEWTLTGLWVGRRHVATLAVHGAGWWLRCRKWRARGSSASRLVCRDGSAKQETTIGMRRAGRRAEHGLTGEELSW